MKALLDESKLIFKDYDQLHSLDICTHCCVDEENEVLLRKSPRFQVPKIALYEYNCSAKSGYTLETASELKYFAPRMLELLVKGAEIHHSTELFLDRFSMVPLQAWSATELDYLTRFARNLLECLLTEESLLRHGSLVDYLIMLDKLPISMSQLFPRLLERKDIPMILQLAEIYAYEVNWTKYRLINGFADEVFQTAFLEFLILPNTLTRIIAMIEQLVWVEEVVLDQTEEIKIDLLYNVVQNKQLINYAK